MRTYYLSVTCTCRLSGAALRWQDYAEIVDMVCHCNDVLANSCCCCCCCCCRFTGEQALPSGGREVLGDDTRVVETTAPGPKCPQGVCQAPGIVA
jgi:hypothetical protein